MTKTINYLNLILKDDETLTGGTSFHNETLMNFLDETELNYSTDIEIVNGALMVSGILPITKDNYDFTGNIVKSIEYATLSMLEHIDLTNDIQEVIKNNYEDFEETEIYNEIDEVYATLGYDHELEHDLQTIGVHGTSDLFDLVIDVLERRNKITTSNIEKSINQFLETYLHLECETHVLKSDVDYDEDNSTTEYNLFETLRQHILKSITISDDELVTDFYVNDDDIKVKVQNIKNDLIRVFKLERNGIVKSVLLNEV